MKRKLIKQGGGGYTIYLPKKWVEENNLKAKDEIEMLIEENKLVISNEDFKEEIKRTELNVEVSHFNNLRSIIGGLYRSGYDEIFLKFSNPTILSLIQKIANSLYGFELLDITDKSCLLKSIYMSSDVDLYLQSKRMIFIIKSMQNLILENLDNETKIEKELFEFRNNVLKQRDLIVRTTIHKKFLGVKELSYMQIAYGLWNVARNYYLLYKFLTKKSLHDKNILEKTINYFNDSFAKIINKDSKNKYLKYEKIRQEILDYIDDNSTSVLVAFCLNIIMAVQSTHSSKIMLFYQNNQ